MNSRNGRFLEGWSTLFLLSGMVMITTWCLTAGRWVDDIQTVEWAALAGLIAGLLLAKTRFPALVAHLFSLVYGAAWVSYLGTTLLPSDFEFREALMELGYHINAWLWSVLHGGSSSDAMMFVLFLAGVVWLMGYMAAWATFRTYRIWWAIIPTATILLINLYWGPPRLLPFLIAYVGFVLLYFIRFNLFRQQQAWIKDRVRYDPEISWDFMRYGVIFIAVVMVFAWGVPGAAASDEVTSFWGKFSEPWQQVQDTWNRLFFSSQRYGQPQPSAFGTSMTLGGAVNLGTKVVMDVSSPAGRYWRATVYDEYTGTGWLNNDKEMAYLEPLDSGFVSPQFEMRRLITQTYTVYQSGRTQLLAAAQPLGIDRPTKVRHSKVPGRLPGDLGRGELLNISIISARVPLESGASYRAVSALPASDEDTLRSAGDDYPNWVLDRYLQLPDSLPQRIRDLAEEITRDATNSYDKASALETYLRQIEYNELIESPPSERDLVDWFLFDLKEGYCDYYSSSLAVMARAVGIPTRIAVGYGKGEYISEVQVYRVRDNNAHAWVEVYFPRYGWLEFEPTAAEPAIVRPRPASSNTNDASNNGSDGDNEYDDLEKWRDLLEDNPPIGSLNLEADKLEWWQTALWIAGGILLLFAVLRGSYWWLEERGLTRLRWVQKAYARMIRFGQMLKVPMQEPQTPYEYAAALSAEVPAGKGPINRITELFVTEQFSPHPVDRDEPATIWRDLRPRLWRRWFGQWIERVQAPKDEQDSLSREKI